jgi:uncharacterized integral membrane protein (TIGR00697 family)
VEKILDRKIIIALALYLTALLAANTLGVKTMPFLFGTHLSVSIFYFPFVYIITDVIGEVYGKPMAKSFVLAGIITTVLFTLWNVLSIVMPWSEASLWAQDSYNTLFGISIRMSIASVVAFAVAEYQDVFAFFFLKKKIGEKRFWLRSNLSNLWSELLDTVLWMTIAFVGVYDFKTLLLMIIPWWLYKVAMGFAYTPLSYLGIHLLRRGSKETAKV